MEFSYYYKHLGKDTRKKYDVSRITHDAEVFQNLIRDMVKPFNSIKFDKVVSQEALGFIVGSAVAFHKKKGFVSIRKGGALPTIRKHVIRTSFTDYSGKRKSLEMNIGSIRKNERILIIDDWIESGEQMRAAIRLIEKQGGIIVGISVINAHKDDRTIDIFKKYQVHALKTIG